MAGDAELFSNKPDDETDFFLIEEEPDTGEMFEHTDLYTTQEFLRILRMIMQRHMDDSNHAPMIAVMEHWERRVTDYVTEHPTDRDSVKIGFRLDEDNVMRIYFTLNGSNFLR